MTLVLMSALLVAAPDRVTLPALEHGIASHHGEAALPAVCR